MEKSTRRGLLTVADVSQALNLKPSTVRQWVWQRKIAYLKVGRCVRFRPEVIEQLIAQGEVPPRRERQ